MAQSHLRTVRKKAALVEKARGELAQAILAAQESGESVRDIAPYANLSWSRVHEIVREARRTNLEDKQ